MTRDERAWAADAAAQDNLDRARIERLAAKILRPIVANYRLGPTARDRSYEALNALACAAGIVLAGVGGGEAAGRTEARGWFDAALEQQIAAWVQQESAREQG